MKVEEIKEAISKFERERVIGEITVHLPSPPKDYKLIANWDLPKEKQKFTYTKQPDKNKEPADEFLLQEFERFQHGYFFFCNGNLEYISNIHYFFLNYWSDKGKQFGFRDAQRDTFLWWMQIEKEKHIAGGNLVTNRRHGKTAIATCIGYFRAATNPFHRCGIQSKTNGDGKLVFGKLIKSWQKLPFWLKPVDSGETRPASILEFSEPRTRSASKDKKVYADVLDSSIDFRSSEENAYDGDELHTYIEDEVGKVDEKQGVNTDKRWEIVQFCLTIGSRIVGKALRTTTVEEMEKKGGKHFKKTWDDSLKGKTNEKTGRTPTMLTNLFVPADFGFDGDNIDGVSLIDEYGYSRRELAVKHILDSWEGLKDDALRSRQRKNPLNLKHAFQVSENSGTFDQEIYDYLDQQKEYLDGTSLTGEKAPKNLRRTVTFYRDIDGLAKWRDDPQGHASFIWDFPKPTMSNARKPGELNQWRPLNCEEFVGGCDPFAATIVSGPGSMGVLYIFRKGNADDYENSGLPILRYAQRTRRVEDFHKNVMIILQYFGCKVNYESDVPDYYETFVRELFRNYVMWTPRVAIDPTKRNHTPRPGTLSKDPYAFQKQFQVLVSYLYARWHKIYFIELIDQLRDFDVNDRTKSDEVIAFSMALLGGWETGEQPKKDTRTPQFLKFKNSQKRQDANGGYVDLSEYHKEISDKIPF